MDLRNRSEVIRTFVVITLGVLTVILLKLIISIETYSGSFSEPSNIFRYLTFGSVASLIVTLSVCYILISTITILLRRILHKKLSGVIWTNLVIATLIIALFADGYFRQRFDFRVRREEVRISNLDPRLEGLKIALISDLHLASFHNHYDKLCLMIDSVNKLKPDILINGGDFISYGWEEFGGCDTILNKGKVNLGSYAVLGNHDDGTYLPDYTSEYGNECNAMLGEKIKSSGYNLLSDSSVLVIFNEAPVTISGVVTHGHHLSVRYGDFEKALSKTDTSALSLFMMHNPVGWDSIVTLPEAPDLTFSGHTHGLQLGLPVPGGYISPASSFFRYWRGLYEKEGRFLYVSTGVGCMGMAERFFMPPEIVLLTIRSK